MAPDAPFGEGWRPQQIDGAETVVLHGEAVVYHPTSHAVHRLAATTAAVWLWCDGSATVAALSAELTPAFDGDAAAAAAGVDDALRQLTAHGLLRGSAPMELLHLLAAEEVRASDGSTVILPSSGFLDADGNPSLGDDLGNSLPHQLVLRLGRQRDRLVVLATDSPASLHALRSLLAAWLDDTVADELARTPATFHVRLAPTPTAHGRSLLPSLRHGSEHVTQSRSAAPVAHALCSLLAGIHDAPATSLPTVSLRAFVRGQRLVFVDAPASVLMADPALADAGISELFNWQLTLAEDGHVHGAAPLPALRWEAAGLDAPAPTVTAWLPVAIGAVGDPSASRGALLAHLAGHCSDVDWFRLVAAAVTDNRASWCPDRSAFRSLVVGPLTSS